MKTVFADTNYWVALVNPQDDLHEKAVKATKDLGGSCHIVTSDMVFAELLNQFSGYGGNLRSAGVELVKKLSQAGNLTIIPQTRAQFLGALEMYKDRPDKEWSLTDCASFLIMQERQILEALTYDIHFQQAGFKALLRDNG
ncbi:MAG: nucleic acid-binding protein [Deltaproteobacteria bacterium HGW-Deltaproteobacteria-9]|nr:MAG: nucleic acid-binding protein [Deltaproteobacteria bacterium HGW-Deltaproteobacteria-9]